VTQPSTNYRRSAQWLHSC